VTLPEPAIDERPTAGPLVDRYARRHTYLRVSVTDRCNYRCTYCMPAEGLSWMPRKDLLSYEEIQRIVRVLVGMGVRRVRLTGGEPLVRSGLVELVGGLAGLGLDDLAMTTNAHRLAAHAQELADAGLTRVNVSMDAVDPDIFRRITRGGDVTRVLAGIDAALAAGLAPVKINAVVVRDLNVEEVPRMVEHFAGYGDDVEVRFIEYMPFDATGGTRRHVPASELRAMLPAMEPLGRGPGGPAVRYRLTDGAHPGQVVGFISPLTEHFCEACNRLRLQADGHLRTCLSREAAPSLRDVLRDGLDDRGLEQLLRQRVWGKVAGHEAHQLRDGAYRPFEGVMTSVGG